MTFGPVLPQPGTTLAGRYVVGNPLGKGAMGVVYEGELIRLEQRVAIKVLRPEILAEPDLMARFDREARLIAKMKSEHVVRVLDVDTTGDGLPFLVMEKLDGRDLGSELRARGPLPVSEAVGYVLQICAGVAEAHRLGIIHRDLKPSNVFLARRESPTLGRAEPERIVKILDFGVSKIVGDANLTATESTLGTPRYMSPEQIRSAKSVDERTDVWSIAVILFEALTGKTPFAGESATGMAAAIVVDQPFQLRDLRPEVPEALEQIVMAALSKSPAQRTPTVAAFAEQLARFAPSHAQVGAPAAVPAPAPSSSGAASPPPNLITVSAPSAVDGGAPPLITASVPPGPTQASWAQPAVASSQPLPMRTIVALFVVLLLGITAALSAGLFFLRRSAPAPASASIDPPALSAHLASARPAASAVVTATGPSVVEPTPASSAPPPGSAAPSAKPSAGPPVAAAPPSARPPSLLSSAAPPASLPKPATKDCAASEKILVGSKLVCP